MNNFIRVLAVIIVLSSAFSFKINAQQEAKEVFVCPPCNVDCHDDEYDAPGTCRICGMNLIAKKATPKVEKRRAVDTTDVWIESDDVRLRASFYLPKNRVGKLPAVVIVHGSAPSTRHEVSFFTGLCLDFGMAVLAYDKRGVGESTGTFRRFSVQKSEAIFDELANDARAVLNWLKKQSEVDPARIGFLGGSQAGWIMPLAASKADDASFIVIFAGTPLSAGEEAYHERLLLGSETGGEVSVAEADRLMAKYNGPNGFDPAPTLRSATAKMLWIFGTEDTVIPTNASIATIKRLIETGHANHEIHVIEGADHNFNNVKSGKPVRTDEIVGAWLKKHGVISSSGDAESTIPFFRYEPDKIKIGAVYHYEKSNIDGSNRGNISLYVAARDRLESLKWRADDAQASLVVAEVDWETFSVRRFESYKINSSGRRSLAATLDALPGGQVAVKIGANPSDTLTIERFPWHSYDFDFASLNFSFPYLIDPEKSFAVGIADFAQLGGRPRFVNKGSVEVVFAGEELRQGTLCRKYAIDGAGLENRGGVIWVSKKDGYFVEYQIDLPDEFGYTSGKLVLQKIEIVDTEAWRNFVEHRRW